MTDSTPSAAELAAATVGACLEQLMDSHQSMRRAVRGLSADAIAWRPPAADTNSITALVSHSLDAERFFVNTALDRTIERDRDAQFARVVDSADELLAEIDAVEAELASLLAELTPDHLTAMVGRKTTRSGVSWLMKAAVHSREHSGQAELTRDLALVALAPPAA